MQIAPTHRFLALLYTELKKSVHSDPSLMQAGEKKTEEVVEPLSPKLKRCYLYIRNFTLRHQVAPARTQVAEHLKISVPTVTWYLRELEKRGWLTLMEGTQRGISLRRGRPLAVIAVERKLAPDEELTADDHVMEYLPEEIGRLLAPNAEVFLRIGEGGMPTPGFRPGDLVGMVRAEPQKGQITVGVESGRGRNPTLSAITVFSASGIRRSAGYEPIRGVRCVPGVRARPAARRVFAVGPPRSSARYSSR